MLFGNHFCPLPENTTVSEFPRRDSTCCQQVTHLVRCSHYVVDTLSPGASSLKHRQSHAVQQSFSLQDGPLLVALFLYLGRLTWGLMMLELAWTDAMTTRLRRWPPLEHLHSGPLAEPWQLPSTIISVPLTGATGGPSAGASTGDTRRHLVQPCDMLLCGYFVVPRVPPCSSIFCCMM